jgi:hypothetical protein
MAAATGACWSAARRRPAPGSDEINRAYEEGWVGNHALAFIGDTLAVNGDKVPELFIVDLPQASRAGSSRAMRRWQGTDHDASAACRASAASFDLYPPTPLPGLVNVPRHWVRANPQATAIAFLMRDDAGVVQLWLISPQGASRGS